MIGVRLGPWIIDSQIGRGGMGTVWMAHRAADATYTEEGDPPVMAAVKVLAPELAVEVGFQQRFQREIDILCQLDHPNIVAFYDSDVQDGRYYYAMEYVDGPSYDSLRDDHGRVPWPDVLFLACQIAPALKHAHDRGVVHRDLKPSNILRALDPADPDAPGTAKLADFGIASLFASPHLTVTGGVIGTPEFLSPEQAAGKPVTHRSDLYSLGIVLYTLVTGRPPFVGETMDLLHKHRFGQFDRPSRLVPDLPPDLDEVICNLLEKDPAKRPGDAGVLYRRLESIRRKLLRQAQTDETKVDPAVRPAYQREGPATLMSRLVRQELHDLDRGGPVKRFFNRPAVLVALFVFCVGAIIWTFWPMSAETLYRHGAALMASEDPDDWERAWEKYLIPLEEKYPDHPHVEELEKFRQRLAVARARQKRGQPAGVRRISDAHWYYEKAIRLRERGQEEEARRLLRAIVVVFGGDEGGRAWVRRAEKSLEEGPVAPDEQRLVPLREALERARILEDAGKKEEAQALRRELRVLYAGDALAERLLKE
jgi:serine/threonine-protein kinase